jgi:hypothetical protein
VGGGGVVNSIKEARFYLVKIDLCLYHHSFVGEQFQITFFSTLVVPTF